MCHDCHLYLHLLLPLLPSLCLDIAPRTCSKSQFERPEHLYGAYGRAARRAGAEAGTGGRDRSRGSELAIGALDWEARAQLDPTWVSDGLKWVGPVAAGDVIVRALACLLGHSICIYDETPL